MKNNKAGNCSICLAPIDTEGAPILALGGFGTPRCLCEKCDSDLEAVTRAKNFEDITAAMNRISTKLTENFTDDRLVIRTLDGIMESARDRAEKIKNGTYDFSLDEEKTEDSEADGVPPELLETEEDREREELENKKAAKTDRIFNWISLALVAVAIGFIIYKFISTYFL